MEENDTIYFRGCLCVPEEKMGILREAQCIPYTIYPSGTKTIEISSRDSCGNV
jgi:hypothetical protein